MTNALINIGDIHLKASTFYKKSLNKFLEWFDKKFPDEARESTEITLAGDVFDKISLLPEVAALAVTLKNVLFKKAHTVYVVLGNHDYGLSHYHVKNTAPLLEKLGFTVIKELKVSTTKGGFKVMWLPWMYGVSYNKVNEFIKNSPKDIDAVVSHWEIEPFFNSGFIDLKDVNAKTYACGHIHSHNGNPKYLGSILPNAVSEDKEDDNSVIKVLIKDSEDSSRFKEASFNIPMFYKLEKVFINNVSDLANITDRENTYYKIMYSEQIPKQDIESQVRLLKIPVYSFEKIKKESVEIGPSKTLLEEDEEYIPQTHEDLLIKCASEFELTPEEMTLAKKVIEEVCA